MGETARVKNGPALRGTAEAVRDAIGRTITRLPEQLRRSLTWDQGAEMAQHPRLRIDTRLRIYFVIRTARGNGARMKTPMSACVSTFQREPISVGTALKLWKPSLGL